MKPITARLETKASRPARSAMRSVVGTTVAFTALCLEHVARASHRVQQRLFEPLVELAPEAADVDVDDVGAGVEVIVPDLLKKHGARDDAAFVAREIFEQEIFAGLEVELLAGALHGARKRIDLQVPDGKAMVGGVHPRFAPTQKRVHAREQLGEGEGFDEIIVGAALEALDAVADRRQRGKNEYRRFDMSCADGA